MTSSWDRQADETATWYDRFTLYLYMGPERTVADAHRFATRMAKGAALGQLNSWRRAAQRNQWEERAAAFDAESGRKALVGDERLRMVVELLHQVYGVLRRAELQTLSKEEARQLLPTFRLFFRDLLRFHQTEAAQFLSASDDTNGDTSGDTSGDTNDNVELNADDLLKLMVQGDGWRTVITELRRVTGMAQDGPASEERWRPLRDALVQLYADESSARRIAAQAQLDVARIHFSARAVDSWHAILTEAAHAGLLEGVIAAALQEYGTNPALAKAVKHYRQQRAQADAPPRAAPKTSRTRRKR